MAERIEVSRRNFLKISAALGGGLLIGIDAAACGRKDNAPINAAAQPAGFSPNAWVRIGVDDRITLMVGSSEMGQGVMTAIPMLLAEELDADWSKVHAEFAPVHPSYANPIIGRQHTGGSTSVFTMSDPKRPVTAKGHPAMNIFFASRGTMPREMLRSSRRRRMTVATAPAKVPIA